MIINIKERLQFWEYDEKGKPKILHAKLIAFLESKGFVNIKLNGTTYVLVRKLNNRISESSFEEATQIIRNHLNRDNLTDIYEVFAKGVGSYLSNRKFSLLDNIDLIDDRDGKDYSRMYFQNCFVTVSSNEIVSNDYSSLEGVIWENRLLNRDFVFPNDKDSGQFEKFCWNISKKDDERFKALKTIIGYLLHRNKDKGEDKAIILYDENMGIGNNAHGGTGKTLLSQAIGQIREVVLFEGKDMKIGSWFKNQRINLTTDVLVYDDLNKLISLENFFPMITSGIEVEKKRKQAFFIAREKSPKLIITSNYLVKGPGGSSDERRRHEYELANHYNERFLPEQEFGNRFFDNHWSVDEWNKFFYFMMTCIQDYLTSGLIKVKHINLDKLKIESNSCKEFIEYANLMVELNKWQDRREFQMFFHEFYPDIEHVSSHKFTKWIKDYACDIGGKYHSKSTGGEYKFIIKKNKYETES